MTGPRWDYLVMRQGRLYHDSGRLYYPTRLLVFSDLSQADAYLIDQDLRATIRSEDVQKKA